MKQTSPLWSLFLLFAAGLTLWGCSGGTDKGPAITAVLVHHVDDNVPSLFSVSVTILDQGGPVTDAAVTLILPDASPVSLANMDRGIYESMDSSHNASDYLPGRVYTFQVALGSSVYSASVTAPGGISIPDHVSGMPISWAFPGSVNVASIQARNSDDIHRFLATLSSPWFPPAEDLANPGIYEVEVSCTRNVLGAFDGGASDSCFVELEDEKSQPVTNP